MSQAASLPGAELFLGNRTFRDSATPVRRTKRRKSEKWTFRNSGTPGRRTRRWKSQKMHLQEFWDSCAQNKTSGISTTALSGILGLLCAEQNVGNLKQMTVRNSGTPVRRTKRRKARYVRNTPTFSRGAKMYGKDGSLGDLAGPWVARRTLSHGRAVYSKGGVGG